MFTMTRIVGTVILTSTTLVKVQVGIGITEKVLVYGRGNEKGMKGLQGVTLVPLPANLEIKKSSTFLNSLKETLVNSEHDHKR